MIFFPCWLWTVPLLAIHLTQQWSPALVETPTKASEGLAQRPHLPASWTKPPRLYCVLTALCTCLFPSGYHDTCNDLFMSLWAVWGHGPCLRLHYNRFAAPDTLKVCLFTEFAKLLSTWESLFCWCFYLGQLPPLLPIPPELAPSSHLDSSWSAGPQRDHHVFPFWIISITSIFIVFLDFITREIISAL